MGKSTMSMAIFNSYLTNYQRVYLAGPFSNTFRPVVCCRGEHSWSPGSFEGFGHFDGSWWSWTRKKSTTRGAPGHDSVQLVPITPIICVYGTQITIVNGVYNPTYNWGGPHCRLAYFQTNKKYVFEVWSILKFEDMHFWMHVFLQIERIYIYTSEHRVP